MKIAVSTGNSRMDKKWNLTEMELEDFRERISKTQRTAETMEQYRKMKKSQQDDIKDVGGFVLGRLKGGRRKKDCVISRSALTLDMDYAVADIGDQLELFFSFQCYLYSTHKHTSEKPRLRLIIPLSHEVSPDEYMAVSRKIAEEIGMELFDDILVQELAGGTISSEIKDNYPAPIADFTVELNYEKVHSLIGKTIPVETIKSIVTSLEMKIVNETPGGLTLQVPPYRVDVQRDCDVVEDILRIYGYNNVEIPTTLKSSLTTKGEVDYSQKLQNLISEQLVGCGFNEILNNSLTAASYYEGLETYKNENLVYLMNPLSNDLNVMRQTLLFGGLESIQHNANRKNADLKFFEFGNCYFYNAEKKNPEKVLAAYAEEYHLGLWVTGKRVSNSWAHPDENSSVYELKAYVLNIFTRLGLNFGNVVFGNLTNDIYSTAISVHTRGGKLLATFGIISKKIQKAFDIDNEVYYAEINWKELMKAIKSAKVNFKELSKFPAVKRDLALLIDKNIQFAEIEKIAYETEKKLLKEIELFDVYEGKNLEPDKKSYAVSFLLQDESATLNDKQIDKIMSKLIANLENKLGAKLR